MTESNPEAGLPDDDLLKALAAFGDDVLDLLEEDDDEWDDCASDSSDLPSESSQSLPTSAERVEQLLQGYDKKFSSDSTLAYAGSIAMACSQAADAPQRIEKRFVVFAIGDHQFGVPMENVVEIARCGDVTPLPRTANWLIGVTNLRGNIVSVTDPCLLFQIPSETRNSRTVPQKLIVIRSLNHQSSTALLVERVNGIRNLEGSVDELSDLTHRIARVSIGTANQDGNSIILVDPDRLMSSSDLLTYSQ